MDIVIARMEPDDIKQVAGLEREIFSMPWSESSFESFLRSKDALYLTVKTDGEVTGYCGFFQSFDEADIMNVAVREDMRGRGIAFRMLEVLMGLGRERGVRRFTLEVRAGNEAALGLYKKLGFESVGIRRGFYEKPREDAVIMWTKGYCSLPCRS